MDVKSFIEEALKKEASDLHLCVGLPPMIRINESLEKLEHPLLTEEDIQKILKEAAPHKKDAVFSGEEIDFGVELPGLARLRVNVYQDKNGLCVACRIIPKQIKPLEELGLPTSVEKACLMRRGLILVTGPAGSGKSTTLAAIIERINSERSAHIITIEDPIEYMYDHKLSIVNQRELGLTTRSFAQALRAALREDPDIILVGEMRDLDTISNAVRAAETGHVVFATLHTKNASQSISRIIDVFPPGQQEQIRFQLAESLEMVISQVLVPSIDKKKRYLACEVMMSNTAIKNLIREKKMHQIISVMERSAYLGMQTIEQSLKNLVDTGKIARSVAAEFAFDKTLF